MVCVVCSGCQVAVFTAPILLRNLPGPGTVGVVTEITEPMSHRAPLRGLGDDASLDCLATPTLVVLETSAE